MGEKFRSVGAELIAAERRRQVEVERWHSTHDDQHWDGELAWAAVCYAAPDNVYRLIREENQPVGRGDFYDPWPWDEDDDRRLKHNRKRQLVIAGALIAAELDRMERENG
jgi:hypothetical protein